MLFWQKQNVGITSKRRDSYYTKTKLNSDYVPLPGFPIKAIFMGYRISSKVRDFLKKFVSTHNIDLYQMTFLPDDIT